MNTENPKIGKWILFIQEYDIIYLWRNLYGHPHNLPVDTKIKFSIIINYHESEYFCDQTVICILIFFFWQKKMESL